MSSNEVANMGIGYFTSFLKYSTDIIICLTEEYNIIEFNPMAEYFFDCPKVEVIGKNYLELCREFKLASFIPEAEFDNLLTHPTSSFEAVVNLPRRRQCPVTCFICRVGENEEAKGYLLIIKDTTQQNAYDNQFKQIQSFLENIAECMPGNFYWKAKDGNYLGCNTSLLKTLGLQSVSDIKGKSDHDLWPKQAEILLANDKEVMESGRPLAMEETVIFNGEQMYFAVVKMPLKNQNGEVIGIIGNSLDITELKQVQAALAEAKDRAEAANQAKSEFLAAVSHELRIPLTGILGMARILAGEDLADYHLKHINDIIISGEHLLALVNDLLNLAKLEAGKLELYPAPFDLRKLIEEIVTMIAFQAKAKNLDLLSNYANDAPHMIIGDARAIRQIFLNLLGNAVKFTERGHINISVECVEREQLKAHLRLIVEDTGIGIPEDKLTTVFERFNQVDSSRTRRYGGAGLGLTITKAYAELMGGRIWVESEVSKGSRFICQIPFPLQDMVHKPSVWDPYRSRLRVLIVDDTLRGEVIAKQLACAHSQVVPGSQAFNTILAAQQNREPFHIVIIDQQLQTIDSMHLGHQISQQRNLHRPMLILLMPPSTVEAKNTVKNSGFYEVLIKPIHPTELLVNLTAAWERWDDNHRAKNKALPIFADHQPTILLVEDDPIIQKVHTMMLEKVGCKVGLAKNSQEALSQYDKKYDAIFMDVGLPGMSGIEIVAEIRRREGNQSHIPIIGVTGYGYEEDKRNCIEAGMDDVAVKPLKPEELTKLLIKWVSKAHIPSAG